jgi:tetratricopeptide (TPR) repeat protein
MNEKTLYPHSRVPWPGLIRLALLALSLAAFQGVLGNGFVNYDDPLFVTDNPHVQAGLTPEGLRWSLENTFGFWHPLTWLSLQLDAELFGGLAPIGYHLTNLLLHLVNVQLLFSLFRRMTGTMWPSAFVAAFWALHPLQVESVAWVAERKGLLSTLFFLLALAAYVRYTEKPSLVRYLLVFFTFALGLMAKTMVITLPFVLLLLDYWPLGRLRLAGTGSARRSGPTTGALPSGESTPAPPNAPGTGSPISQRVPASLGRLVLEKCPLFVLAAGFALLTLWAEQEAKALPSTEVFPMSVRFKNIPIAYAGYLGHFFWPAGLAVFYPHPGDIPLGKSFLAAAMLVLLTGLCLWHGKGRPYLAIGWLWFLAMLLPVIGLIQVGAHALADRYMYLPMIGLLLAVSWGLAEVVLRGGLRRGPAATLALGLLVACLFLTRLQVSRWHDSVTLWEHTLAVTKDNFIAHQDLAVVLEHRGQLKKAIPHYLAALQIEEKRFGRLVPSGSPAARKKPTSYAVRHYTLAFDLKNEGLLDQSEEQFTAALKQSPNFPEAHAGLARLLLDQGRLERALLHFSEAARLAPKVAEAQHDLGMALEMLGKTCRALPCYRRAVCLDPKRVKYRCSLAAALYENGQRTTALAEFRQALRLDPDWINASHLASRHFLIEQPTGRKNVLQSLVLAKRVCLATGYKDPIFVITLAEAYGRVGRYDQAATAIERALRVLSPSDLTAPVQELRDRLFFYKVFLLQERRALTGGSLTPPNRRIDNRLNGTDFSLTSILPACKKMKNGLGSPLQACSRERVEQLGCSQGIQSPAIPNNHLG